MIEALFTIETATGKSRSVRVQLRTDRHELALQRADSAAHAFRLIGLKVITTALWEPRHFRSFFRSET